MKLPDGSAIQAIQGIGLKSRNFKCFGEKPEGFETFKHVNVIIGRNNSGKSTLLDLLFLAKESTKKPDSQWRRTGSQVELIWTAHLLQGAVEAGFSENQKSAGNPKQSDRALGTVLLNSKITWNESVGENRTSDRSLQPRNDSALATWSRIDPRQQQPFIAMAVNGVGNPFAGLNLRRLRADRDIRPEVRADPKVFDENGNGATNLIQSFLHRIPLPAGLVESTLLNSLNEIFSPDCCFTRIRCREQESTKWEILLDEKEKEGIPLSESGSGLKTVVLVLANILLLPYVTKTRPNNYVYCFEELENNLHPAVLRRLLRYLAEHAKASGCVVVITTHSSAAIDFFSKDENAQIVHVRHQGGVSSATKVESYVENCGILDDLDVRASDLLQANGVVWVEGPSDRIYLNRWIEIFGEGELREGEHYQCVFYGGRLLAHLEATADRGAEAEGVAILRVARNSAVLMDSDKDGAEDLVNATKRRIEKEVSEVGGFSWITEGREVENYVSPSVIAKFAEVDSVPTIAPFEDVFRVLDSLQDGLGKRYEKKKHLLAEKLSTLMSSRNDCNAMDLPQRMEALCNRIRRWNGLKSRSDEA